MDELAIHGNYADFKLVKTRNVAQLVIEIPIERAKQAIDAFGIPQPSSEIAVAVARLHPNAQKQKAPVEASAGATGHKERTRSQWAAIRCNDPEFAKWLGWGGQPPGHVARALRQRLGILSRKELDSNPAKAAAWDQLDSQFLQDTGRMAKKIQ